MKIPARPLLALALLALLLAVPAGASAKSIRGIDVSRFQGIIGWKQVGETKLRFAFLQASRGSGNDCLVASDECGGDQTYDRNYRNAKDVGLRVGAYHRAFASGSTPQAAKEDAREEANLFISVVGKVRNADLRPAIDVETPFDDMTEFSLRAWIKAWSARVESKLGERPIIYTNASSWSATGDTASFADNGHPLWVANFDVPKPQVPAGNWGGDGWAIWQFTSSGRVRGIEGRVDKNRLSKGFGRISAG
jgi:GH25 family lysozyme M1 (1,4-beta-N-acetylmuramidase)